MFTKSKPNAADREASERIAFRGSIWMRLECRGFTKPTDAVLSYIERCVDFVFAPGTDHIWHAWMARRAVEYVALKTEWHKWEYDELNRLMANYHGGRTNAQPSKRT